MMFDMVLKTVEPQHKSELKIKQEANIALKLLVMQKKPMLV